MALHDMGTSNPLAEQEKQISELIKVIESLRDSNRELKEIISSLKDMINKAYSDYCSPCASRN